MKTSVLFAWILLATFRITAAEAVDVDINVFRDIAPLQDTVATCKGFTLVAHSPQNRHPDTATLKRTLEAARHAFSVLDLDRAGNALMPLLAQFPVDADLLAMRIEAELLQARIARLQNRTDRFDQAITSLALLTFAAASPEQHLTSDIAAKIVEQHRTLRRNDPRQLRFAPPPVTLAIFGTTIARPWPETLPEALFAGLRGWYPSIGWVALSPKYDQPLLNPALWSRRQHETPLLWTHDGDAALLLEVPAGRTIWRAGEPAENLCRHLSEHARTQSARDTVQTRRRRALIWSTTSVLAGGLAAAIAVPLTRRPSTGGIRISWD